jgi:hypothetical protein
MRRSPEFKYQFASCVGKRMLAERIISRGRTSIIEHHRAVSWGEREYRALLTLVKRSEVDIKVNFENTYIVDVQKEPISKRQKRQRIEEQSV